MVAFKEVRKELRKEYLFLVSFIRFWEGPKEISHFDSQITTWFPLTEFVLVCIKDGMFNFTDLGDCTWLT